MTIQFNAYYAVHMSTTITIRTDEKLREELEQRARAQGKSLSVLVREILILALEDSPMGNRSSHLRGALNLGGNAEESWRRKLAERNWRS